MRSSKKRSRSSQNRPRTLGNIINRVFDSSGPEGKVRGTPQQIIEKYQMLARDAQLSNDRVAAENFLQHAEHYTRMLAEATREMAAEQEARQQQFQQSGGQGGQNGGQNGSQNGSQNGGHYGSQGGGQNSQQPRGDRQDRGDRSDRQDRTDSRSDYRSDSRPERRPEFQREDRDPTSAEQPRTVDVIALDAIGDSGLIETPEAATRARAETRSEGAQAAAPVSESGERSASRRPRGPRKPKTVADQDGTPPKEAAE